MIQMLIEKRKKGTSYKFAKRFMKAVWKRFDAAKSKSICWDGYIAFGMIHKSIRTELAYLKKYGRLSTDGRLKKNGRNW